VNSRWENSSLISSPEWSADIDKSEIRSRRPIMMLRSQLHSWAAHAYEGRMPAALMRKGVTRPFGYRRA
jgi:hypothetical protein